MNNGDFECMCTRWTTKSIAWRLELECVAEQSLQSTQLRTIFNLFSHNYKLFLSLPRQKPPCTALLSPLYSIILFSSRLFHDLSFIKLSSSARGNARKKLWKAPDIAKKKCHMKSIDRSVIFLLKFFCLISLFSEKVDTKSRLVFHIRAC